MFPKLGLLEEASILRVPMYILEYSPDCSRNSQDEQQPDVPSECHHASICDIKRGGRGLASEEKVIFVLKIF